MKNYTFKEKYKTRRTVITGLFGVIVAVITALGTISAIIIQLKNNTPQLPPTVSSEVSSVEASTQEYINKYEELCETTALYYGESYSNYSFSSNSFTIGSQRYNCGFTIKSPNLDQDKSCSNGFVLIDLANKYSKVSFYAGMVEGSPDSDALLVVYLDGKIKEEFKLPLSLDIEINVSGAKNLRLELIAEKEVVYGFANVYLYI